MAAPTKPNVLLLITDNQRLDTLGILEQTACHTPTWDRVARGGVLLTHLRTTSPICSPARASLLTGMHPHQAGMPTVAFAYAQSNDGSGGERSPGITRPPVSHLLRQHGYEAIYTGKWHLGHDNIGQWFDRTAACDQAERDYSEWCRLQGIPDGFVFHDPVRSEPFRSKHPPGMSLPTPAVLDIPEDKEHNFWVLGHALEQFALRRPEQPYFVTLSFEGPHPPLMVPSRYYDMYDPAAIPKPANWDPGTGEPEFLQNSYYRLLRREFGDDFDAWRKSIAVYWGYTTYIDALLGRYLARWEEAGLMENTLVVMVSDHGDMLGQHGLSQKMCPYEEALRVPCVLSWPGVLPAGRRCDLDLSLMDLAPTILAAAGIDAEPLGLAGENLLPLLTGRQQAQGPRDIHCQYDMTPFQASWQGVANWRCIVRRPWKYVHHESGEVELFDLQRDPGEMHNLAGGATVREPQAQLHDALWDWSRHTGDLFAANARVHDGESG